MQRRFLLLLLLLVPGLSVLLAQRPDVLPPRVFALQNARIVTEPGKVIAKGTVVIRDGVIEAVGADVKAPADALVLDAQGFTVYPGFIDACSHWGLDMTLRRPEGGPPATPDVGSDALFASSQEIRKGISPEFRAATALKDDEQMNAWRKLGFTARLVGPEGGILAGQGAILSLSGAPPRNSLLLSPAVLHVSLKVPPGDEYPRSLMGVIAHARQTLLDAQHHRELWQNYERRKQAGRRPPHDPALAALAPYLEGKRPVVFEADTADEIGRALSLAGEFHLLPLILGGRDAWKVTDQLRASKASVILRFVERPARPEGRSPLPQRVEKDLQNRKQEDHRCASVLAEKGIPFAISTSGQPADKFRASLRHAVEAGLTSEASLRALTADAARILDVQGQLGTIAPGKAAHLVVMDGEPHEADAQVKYVFSDGVRFEYDVVKRPNKPSSGGQKNSAGPGEVDEKNRTSEIDSDRVPAIRPKGNVLLRGANLVTVSQGTLANTDLLVIEGRIRKMGKGLKPPENVGPVKELDARGTYVMPGIVDTHSHFAIAGGVNEFSLSVVPEVRVRDVINSEDVQIYRGLAGGVTTARLLHGSANVIGGQDAVIKLKYGQPVEKLLVADAPRGIKFALGENVKRTGGRFPNSRLGVEAVLVRAFTEARAYQQSWDDHHRALKKLGPDAIPPAPPRRDLRLEALVDVLKGDLRVHCHCYRSDEILMLLRVADRFGIKIRSLQHVLEGYKIAPEIADHGASCSLFADWWAYKLEAFDAIPYAAALLQKAGAQVCLKSDSNELMRHLYQEAAKCIKYGGMSEDDALKTITLNPARQLGLEKRIGSLEEGKDADLVVFSGHPLNSYSRVEMVLIEGEVYFQRSEQLTPYAPAAASPRRPVDFKAIERNPQGKYALVGVTVHPANGPEIPKAAVIIHRGRIEHIARNVDVKAIEFGKDVTVVEAWGKHLYPGMIDASTILGLAELGSARETNDYADSGDFQPDLRASIAINPDSELIPVTRANGVTTVVTRPTGSIIAGQGALINLAGWVPKEMTLVDPIALHIDFPTPTPPSNFLTDPNGPNPARAIAREQRAAKIRKLKELFQLALTHDVARREASTTPANPRLEALIPYARGEKPVIIQAHRQEEIREAIKLADELKIKIILSGAIDSWKVAEELKKRDIPVVLGPVMALPSESHDPYDAPYTCAEKLHRAGVRFCIRSSGGSNTRNLPYEAAMAVSHGLPPQEGLKAVTLYPARILGVEKDLGTIEAGKRANLVLTNGDILQPSTQVLSVFIDGKPLAPTNKQTRLYERYLERLEEVKSGRAPLGTR